MRRLIVRLMLLGFGCLLSLGVLELVIRIADLAPSQGVGSVTESDFERVPGLLTPGQDLIDREKPALPYHVRINSLGYRGAELPDPKTPGELRILAVGDSFTFGDFVDDDETLPAQLEAALRARCENVSVINAGIGGTTLVTAEQMIRRALPLEPDLVLLTFSENDVVDMAAPLWWSLAANRRAKSRFPLSIVYPVLRHTALWNFALHVRGASAARARPERGDASGSDASESARQQALQTDLRGRYAEHLTAIRDLVDDAGIPLAYALYPSHHTVLSPDREDQMRWAERLGEDLGLKTVNFLTPLRASAEPIERLYLLPEDGHPSPLGYQIAVADLIESIDWSRLPVGACGAPGGGSTESEIRRERP